MISIFDDTATPHSNDPSSKMPRNVMKMYWTDISKIAFGRDCVAQKRLQLALELKWVYSLPLSGCSEQLSTRVAVSGILFKFKARARLRPIDKIGSSSMTST